MTMDADQLQAAVDLLRGTLGTGAKRKPLTSRDTRPVRDHFLETGEPKRMLSEADAQAEAARLGQRRYRCRTCRFWHLGHGHSNPQT